MGFFDESKNVEAYLKMAEGYDGKELIDELVKYLDKGSSLLELGMGPGKDLDMLKQHFKVTGSDKSKVFIDLYKEKYPNDEVLYVDAVEMDLPSKYDCIYTNKVLHHLTTDSLKTSISNQVSRLTKSGLIMHSFWYGSGEENYDGLRFIYYKEDEIRAMFEPYFDILVLSRYSEASKDDSMYIIARVK